MDTNYQRIRRIVADAPGASYWLKAAVEALDKRDPVDALNDAEELLAVAQARVARLQEVGLYATIPGVHA